MIFTSFATGCHLLYKLSGRRAALYGGSFAKIVIDKEQDRMRVLLADDQVWLRSAMRLLLEHEPNIEVVGEAHDLSSLVQAAKALLPDLILLDWELPGLGKLRDHKQFVERLHSANPLLRIIALSVNSDAKMASLAMGVDGFVNKAEPPEHLLATLHHFAQNYLR